MFKIGDKVKRKASNQDDDIWYDSCPNGKIDGVFTVSNVSNPDSRHGRWTALWLKEKPEFTYDPDCFELVEPKKYTIEEVVDALTKMCIVNGSVNEYVEAVEQHFKEKDEEYQLYLKLKAKYEDSK